MASSLLAVGGDLGDIGDGEHFPAQEFRDLALLARGEAGPWSPHRR